MRQTTARSTARRGAVSFSVLLFGLGLGITPAGAADPAPRLPPRAETAPGEPPADKPDPSPPKDAKPGPARPPAADPGKGNPPAGDSGKGNPPAEDARNPSRVGVIRDFPAGTADAVLREAFRCALDSSESDGFDCYTRLNVELNRDNENALVHLRTYQWRYFRQRAPSYIVATEPFSVRLTRRDPASIDASAKTVKLFLKSRTRENPAPIIFRREGGEWRIYANSL